MNKYISKIEVESILNRILPLGDNGAPLTLKNLKIYQNSFVHKSYLLEQRSTYFQESNERLEFLGDSFIGSIVATYLMERFPAQQEGFLTKLRTRIVRSSMLYRFARFLGLGQYILLSQQVEKLTSIGPNKGRNNPKLYEDTFEAFIGAIIQDFGDVDGYKYAKRFIIGIIEYIIDFSELILCNENFKDSLQRYFQSRKWNNPVYIDLFDSGPSHSKCFVKGVFLKQEYFQELDENICNVILNYQESIGFNSKEAVKKYNEENKTYLIGLGSAPKKSVAEQISSSIAMGNLNISQFF